MNRRTFIQQSSSAAALAFLPFSATRLRSRADVDVIETTITDLQNGMEAGDFTARDLVETYLRRIEEIDQAGPIAALGHRSEPRSPGNGRSTG